MSGAPLAKSYNRWIGAGFWAAAVIVSVVGLAATDATTRRAVQDLFWSSSGLPGDRSGRATVVTVVDPTGWLQPGDSAFKFDGVSNQWHQVGFVIASEKLQSGAGESDDTRRTDQHQQSAASPSVRAEREAGPAAPPLHAVTLRLSGVDRPVETLDFRVRRASGKLDAVLATLVPEAKRRQLMEKIKFAMRQHGEAITDAMLPVVLDAFAKSVPAIESELKRSVQRHQPQIDSLVARYRRVIVQERLVPLAQEEVLPVLLRHGQGPAEEIGREIWDRAPLWQLGWRAAYDQSPLPQRDMLQAAWRRFVDEEVTPILRDHTDQIVAALEKTMVELSANEAIREEFAQLARQIVRDPEVQELARQIVREAIVENRHLRTIWVRTWSSPQARQALKVAGRRIEPLLREIGDEVMGTRTEGIEPGFARVLRNQILGKDRVWLTVHDGNVRPSGTPIMASLDPSFAVYPVVRLARPTE